MCGRGGGGEEESTNNARGGRGPPERVRNPTVRPRGGALWTAGPKRVLRVEGVHGCQLWSRGRVAWQDSAQPRISRA